MRSFSWIAFACLAGSLFTAVAQAQPRPYIGFVYPAGAQQGATTQIRLGGQNMDDVTSVQVTGKGVSARVVEYYWRQNNQEQALLNEQLRNLKKATQPPPKPAAKNAPPPPPAKPVDPETAALIEKLERRTGAFVQTPACWSLASLLFVEITVAPDAEPGPHEIRVSTIRGVSNPMPFMVGQVPEHTREAMRTATIQILGKEAQSLRKRPPEQMEARVNLPVTLNGQIASGEVNQYRFAARKGQRLLFSAQARQLVPFIADAVPGWFQPVLVLTDGKGKEVAYNDDYRFKPDPTLFYEVAADGDYVLSIYDSLYRGREDFVYRITAGELPFLTSIFPLGGRAGVPLKVAMNGWNLDKVAPVWPPANATPGIYSVAASRDGFVTNRMPYALDTLPEAFDKEPNNDLKRAQRMNLPVIVNGRIDKPGDWDVYEFEGKANQTIVAEVQARRLDSPLDSVVKITDVHGKTIAFNDDHEDIGSGANTHHADSYLMTKLPADGTYYVHIGDTTHAGGEEYAYRLRISLAMPDFELRLAPSSISLRSRAANSVTVYVIRKDGFNAPIKLALKNPPAGIVSAPATLWPNQAATGITIRTTLASTPNPVELVVEGKAVVDKKEIAHDAVPAEDRMQAFLWRHLVPVQNFASLVFDPSYQLPLKKVPPELPPAPAAEPGTQTASNAMPSTATPAAPTSTGAALAKPPTAAPATAPTTTTAANTPPKPKFTQQQVAQRLRELKRLYNAGFLTDDFYLEKVAECQVTQ